MPYKDLYSELMGMVPKMSLPYRKTVINRAWKDVRHNNLWSFQLYEGPQWITPNAITSGTVEVTLGSDTVTADADALAAINTAETDEATWSPITKRQFRVSGGTIYNIIDWTDPVLTLDRIYSEASNTEASYQIFQCYYPAPYEDHLFFMTIRNLPRFVDLILNESRADIDLRDPQRSWGGIPSHCVYYQVDSLTGSTTLGYNLYELWGVPLSFTQYILYGIRTMPDLSSATDVLPNAVGEDLVMARAKYYAYEWAEANKDVMSKGGPDFKFLMKETNANFTNLLRDYRRRDRETVDNWFSQRRLSYNMFNQMFYNSVSARASSGGY